MGEGQCYCPRDGGCYAGLLTIIGPARLSGWRGGDDTTSGNRRGDINLQTTLRDSNDPARTAEPHIYCQ